MRAFSGLTGLLCIMMLAAMDPSSRALAQGAVKSDLKACELNEQPEDEIAACGAALGGTNLGREIRARYLWSRARAHTKLRQFDRALDDWSAAAELSDAFSGASDVNKYYAKTQRAFTLLNLDRVEEARKQLDEIVEARRRPGSSPDTPPYTNAYKLSQALYSRGSLDDRLGEYTSALAFYRESERTSTNSSALWGIASVSRRLGDHDTAISYYSRIIELGSGSEYGGLINRAEAKRLKGDLEGASSDLKKVVELEPKMNTATRNMMQYSMRLYGGRIFRDKGELDAALAEFNGVIAAMADTVEPYVDRGLTYEKMGELEKARADYQTALTKASANNSAAARDITERATARIAALDKGAPLAALPAAPAKASAKPEAAAKPPAEPKSPVKGASKETRVALVIGNSRYKSVPALPNPSNDASAIAGAFRALGFQTVSLTSDVSRETLVNELRKFAEKAEGADWAVIYYAGHGIEVGGVNYLIPVDAKLASDRDVQFEAVSLDQVLASVEGAKKLKLVVLDACRVNPFDAQMRRTVATRAVGRGLTRVEPEGATLVVFAAKHGQTALDGTGGNSPFAQALVNRLATPDVEINKTFRLVRDDVMKATAGRQEPFTYGSLPGDDFFFASK